MAMISGVNAIRVVMSISYQTLEKCQTKTAVSVREQYITLGLEMSKHRVTS